MFELMVERGLVVCKYLHLEFRRVGDMFHQQILKMDVRVASSEDLSVNTEDSFMPVFDRLRQSMNGVSRDKQPRAHQRLTSLEAFKPIAQRLWNRCSNENTNNLCEKNAETHLANRR